MISYHVIKDVLTIWEFTILLRYDNNVMTIWNMLIVVKYRKWVEAEPNWRYLLKNFRFYTICNNNEVDNANKGMNFLYQLVQDCLKLSLIPTISGYKYHAVSAGLMWSYILLLRNHPTAQPPRSGLIGAKTGKQRFELNI